MSLLTETQISEELAAVPGWTRDGNSIVTVTERADFRDALLYLGAVFTISVVGYLLYGWNLIDSVVESFVEESDTQLKILKTVGILNLLNDNDLLATEESVVCALANPGQEKSIRAAITALNKHKRIIYDRGRARGGGRSDRARRGAPG